MAIVRVNPIEKVCKECGNKFLAVFPKHDMCSSCYHEIEYDRVFDARAMAEVMFVYLIICENGTMKIGKSNDPFRRVKDLQQSRPEKIELAGYMACNNFNVHSIERNIHKDLDDIALGKEWFTYSEENFWRAVNAMRRRCFTVTPPNNRSHLTAGNGATKKHLSETKPDSSLKALSPSGR